MAAIKPNPISMLWHVARGAMPGFHDETCESVGWVRMSHRGVQYLDKFTIPRKQKSYIFNPKWEIRFNTSFENVLRNCADTTRHTIQTRSGKTWITEPLIQGLLQLHKMGFAHSYEAWTGGELAGGVWGFQIGAFVSMNSMFHNVSNASKAAFARAQLHLRERGFTMVDMNGVPDHMVNFGIEWIPQWKYEQEVARLVKQDLSILPEHTPVAVPWQIKSALPIARKFSALQMRLKSMLGKKPPEELPPQSTPAPTTDH